MLWLAGSRVQNPDIRPVFQKPTRTGADKEDVSGKIWTYVNPMLKPEAPYHHIISQTFAMAPINQSLSAPHITNTIVA